MIFSDVIKLYTDFFVVFFIQVYRKNCFVKNWNIFNNLEKFFTSGLGQQRQMPSGLYTQEKTLKQEEKVITKLQTIERDSMIGGVYQRQARLLLEG